MAVEKITLMFNRGGSKGIIGALPKTMDRSVLDLSEIYLMDLEYDPEVKVWIGSYDTGSLKNINDIATTEQIIEEDILDQNVADLIANDYPLYKQLNIIIDMLNKSDVPNTPEFTAMMEYIKDQRDRNNARKEVYKQDGTPYVFVSKEELQQSVKKRLNLD